MKRELVIKDSNENDLVISVVGEFKIDELDRKYIIYSIVDSNENNPDGQILIGEIVEEDGNLKVLGIRKEEKELVLRYYNEISNQLGE